MYWNERIRGLREDTDLNQTEMGKILQATQRQISNWEVGRNEPPFEILIKYAMYFNTTTDYILGLTDEPRKLY
ncbi:MAG: helix-turn-helix domain-containing protein [Oscillospiraceae bacterium]|nr:helix-turn-helix domain-containing protein [Oscillospiraceae bacterium]